MGYRLLLGENVEHEVLRRLEDADHDVLHVDLAPGLGKGVTDRAIAQYSIEADRTILTYDDDFVGSVPPGQYRAALFVEDQTMSATEIAAVIDAMAQVYPHDEVRGLPKVGREWL